MFGAFFYYPRLIALICTLFLTFIHQVAIISTAVLRFRSLGKLCALSEQPTKKGNLDWTYRSDGALISVLWTFQLLLYAPFCLTGWLPMMRQAKV